MVPRVVGVTTLMVVIASSRPTKVFGVHSVNVPSGESLLPNLGVASSVAMVVSFVDFGSVVSFVVSNH